METGLSSYRGKVTTGTPSPNTRGGGEGGVPPLPPRSFPLWQRGEGVRDPPPPLRGVPRPPTPLFPIQAVGGAVSVRPQLRDERRLRHCKRAKEKDEGVKDTALEDIKLASQRK